MQGRSFWGDLTGGQVEPPTDGLDYRYWEHDDVNHRVPAHYGYRTDRHKLIYFYNDGLGVAGASPLTYPPERELYDLEADPPEVHNIHDDPAYAEVREDLKARMWRAQAAVGDQPHPSQSVPEGIARRPDAVGVAPVDQRGANL